MKIFAVAIILFVSFGFYKTGGNSNDNKGNQDSVYNYRSPSRHGIGKFYKGREIAGIMSAGGSGWLDRSTRQEEENSSLAVEQMRFESDAAVADIGAGTGYYTFKIAEKVKRGKVFAVEIQDRFIEILKDRISTKGVKNVEVVKGGTQSPNLPANSIDYALMVDVYHELEYPQEMLKAIKESLKPGGKLILMEYRAEDESIQIIPLHKTSIKQLRKELEANGFKLVGKSDSLPIQHLLFFQKN
jgi:ubiquinone/menaquinone biosynthesis C-methylase UbiE